MLFSTLLVFHSCLELLINHDQWMRLIFGTENDVCFCVYNPASRYQYLSWCNHIVSSVIKRTVIYCLQSQVEGHKRTNSSAWSGNTRSLDKFWTFFIFGFLLVRICLTFINLYLSLTHRRPQKHPPSPGRSQVTGHRSHVTCHCFTKTESILNLHKS